MSQYGKLPRDVAWVGSLDGSYAITWEEFIRIGNVMYYSGHGGHEIPLDLVIVFYDSSWIEREDMRLIYFIEY